MWLSLLFIPATKVVLFFRIQVLFWKENSAHYDAGIAIDDVRFYDCPLPRPTIDSECPENEWRCGNQVIMSGPWLNCEKYVTIDLICGWLSSEFESQPSQKL